MTTDQQQQRFLSAWSAVPQGPPDAILGINDAFKADTSSKKINLGVGAYRTPDGKPWVLPTIKKAEKAIIDSDINKEYGPITGDADFLKHARELAYGTDAADRICISQSLSGTGALRLGGQFLSRFYENGPKEIYLPTPTWGNHTAIFKDAALTVKNYRYFDKKTNGLNLDGMLDDIKNASKGSIILLHACAHNPTGVDPTPQQWETICSTIQDKQHYVFFDMAYQGFASGDLDRDAQALRLFVARGQPLMLAQSFAKNMGLYGERVGTFSIVCADADERKRVESQLKIIVRPMYSNPPLHGARIAKNVLQDPQMKQEWIKELQTMAGSMKTSRDQLTHQLVNQCGSKRNWDHIKAQIGMFCFSGLTPEQVEQLRNEYHIYMTKDGRISIAGVNESNVEYLAQSIHNVTK